MATKQITFSTKDIVSSIKRIQVLRNLNFKLDEFSWWLQAAPNSQEKQDNCLRNMKAGCFRVQVI